MSLLVLHMIVVGVSAQTGNSISWFPGKAGLARYLHAWQGPTVTDVH